MAHIDADDLEMDLALALQDEIQGECDAPDAEEHPMDMQLEASPPVAPPSQTMASMMMSSPPETPTLTSVTNSLSDAGVEISDETLITCADEMFSRWILYQDENRAWAFVAVYRLFGLDPNVATCDVGAVSTVEKSSRDTCLRLYNRMVSQGVIQSDDPTDVCAKRLTRVIHIIGQSAQLIISNHHRENATTTNYNAATSVAKWKLLVGPQLAGDAEAVAGLSGGQRLLLTVLEKAFQKNLRKHQGYMFEQVVTVDANGREYRTHAWKEYCSVKDFVYKCANKHEDWETWKDLTASMRNPEFVADYISNSTDDLELPSLNPNRHVFSFTNGVYDAYMDKMYSYEEGVPDDFVTAKFFKVPMPADHPHGTSFRDIPTPALDGILSHQGFGTEPVVPEKYAHVPGAPAFSVTDWIYVFMGRMIYSVGEFDTWQALMFMKGKAGTGKSTLGKVISYLYNPVDVAVLSNNIEQKFGLSGIYEALIYLCYEVKKDFKLDQGEMQSMISGEPISIAIKNKEPKSITWSSHGFFMGNEFPRWANNSGSIGRRIVVALFDTMVTDGDPKLFDKLQAEMGNIIVKINRAYRECSAVYGSSDIWSVLPPYFDEQRERELEAATSVVSAYMVYLKYEDQGRTYTFSAGDRVPSTRFKNHLNEWVSDNLGIQKYEWNKEKENLARYNLVLDGNELVGLRESAPAVQ